MFSDIPRTNRAEHKMEGKVHLEVISKVKIVQPYYVVTPVAR